MNIVYTLLLHYLTKQKLNVVMEYIKNKNVDIIRDILIILVVIGNNR